MSRRFFVAASEISSARMPLDVVQWGYRRCRPSICLGGRTQQHIRTSHLGERAPTDTSRVTRCWPAAPFQGHTERQVGACGCPVRPEAVPFRSRGAINVPGALTRAAGNDRVLPHGIGRARRGRCLAALEHPPMSSWAGRLPRRATHDSNRDAENTPAARGGRGNPSIGHAPDGSGVSWFAEFQS